MKRLYGPARLQDRPAHRASPNVGQPGPVQQIQRRALRLHGLDSLFAAANAGKRIEYVAHGVIAYLPRSERRQAVAFDSARLERLRAAVAAWYGASRLSRDAFRARFLDPYTSAEVVDRLREAARGMVEARTLAALGAAGADLAAAVQKVGVDRWPRFLANAEERAVAAVSKGDVPGVMRVSAADAAVGIGGLILLGGLGLALHALRDGQSGAGTAPASPGPAPSPLPPTVVTAVPVPPPKEGETSADVLKPGGQLVGKPGSDKTIRELPGGQAAAEELFDRLSKGGKDIAPPRYPGRRVRLPNGDEIEYRPASTSGPPTIDVEIAGVSIRNIKFPEK